MDVKQLTDQINAEWAQLKGVLQGQAAAEVEKFGKALGDTTAKMDLINERINALELSIQRPGFGGADAKSVAPKDAAKTAAFEALLRKGERQMTPDQIKALSVLNDTTGGYGATAEFDSAILKGVIDLSPVRSIVRVRNTSKRSVKIMKRTGTFAAQWIGEQQTRTETTGLTYGLEEIPTHEIYAMVDISRQDLEDNDFDLEAELRSEFAEQFALAEGIAVVSGNGYAKPEGFMSNAAVASVLSGAAGALSYDGLVDVSHGIKAGYFGSAGFVFNLATLGAIRKMKDSQNLPIWAPMAEGAPATVLGFRYTIMQAMPDIGAANYPVAFGDFKRAYQLVDRVALEIVRDDLTQASVGAVRFWARKRLGGQVVLAEALRKLKSNNA
jgi:HK97 family phage major capsid protein